MKGINKIKIVIVGLFVITQSLCLFSEDALFDFDGRNNNQESIINFTNKSIENNCIKKAFIMDEKGELKESIPFYSYIDEKGRRVNEHYFLPQQKVKWEISCNNQENKPWTVTETYLYVYGNGGHYHNDPLPPYLKVTNVRTDGNEPADSSFKDKPSPFDFPYMMSNVKYYYWEKMPEFSIRIAEYFKWKEGCNGEQLDYLNVLVPKLEVLTAGAGYNLVGETDSHPYNHYGTKSLIDTLISIANDYKSIFPSADPLNINDMSLEWGGLFDLDSTWVSSTKNHNLHRCGNQADIGKITIPKENRRKFIEVVCKKTKFLLSEEPPHYHISLNQNEPYYCNPPKAVEKGYIQCCKDNGTIHEGNIEECIK